MTTTQTEVKTITVNALTVAGQNWQLVPANTFKAGGADEVLKYIKDSVTSLAPSLDPGTRDGLDLIRTTAAEIRSAKARLDEAGAELKKNYSAMIDPIDAERRRIKTELEELAVKTRQPLTDIENKEKARVAAHTAALAALGNLTQLPFEPSSADVQGRLDALPPLETRGWEEYSEQALQLIPTVRTTLNDMLARRLEVEKQAAELIELRKQQELQRQKDHDAQVAANAAAEATRLAEAKAQAALDAERRYDTLYIAALQDNADFDRMKAQAAALRAAAPVPAATPAPTPAPTAAPAPPVAAIPTAAELLRYVKASEVIIRDLRAVFAVRMTGIETTAQEKQILLRCKEYLESKELYF